MPSRAVLTEVQTIPNADIVQALANLKIVATPGIITTLPQTTSTLAALETAQTFTLDNVFSSATASTSTASGAVKIAGGLGVIGAGYFGSLNCQSGEILALSAVIGLTGLTNAGPTTLSSTLSITLNTDATSSTSGGAVTIAGGLAVAKKAFIGTLLDLVATTSTAGQITQAGAQFIHTYGTDNLFLGGAGNPTLASMSGTGLNVAIGKSAMAAATTTTGNMAIGKGSLGSITTSANFSNVALGNQCLDVTTSAIEAIAIGNNCQRSMSSQYSVTIGNLANAGNYSVAVGYDALNATTASALACVAIGRDAMKLCTGERNTACGHSAGSTITNGTYNSLFGEMAQTGSASATYRTAIGAGAVGTVNNSIKLGRNHTPSVPGDMVILPSVLTANLPIATAAMAGAIIYVSDDGTGHINFCNGSAWARIN
jgi:hypothetical protein